MDIPHHKISYAQNHEDLLLAGILREVSGGFYVDVGANDPELDSVTKVFYDKGWSGINVEPNGRLFEKLRAARPRDVNLNCGIAAQSGVLTFRDYAGLDGMSTFSDANMRLLQASRPEAAFSESQLPVISLAQMFREHRAQGDIHFMKIDVEGLELEVLIGNRWTEYRPWLLCIERSLDASRNRALATYLDAVQYFPAFFDGINDYFVAKERQAVWDGFSYARDVVLNGVPVNYIFIKCILEYAAALAATRNDGAPQPP